MPAQSGMPAGRAHPKIALVVTSDQIAMTRTTKNARLTRLTIGIITPTSVGEAVGIGGGGPPIPGGPAPPRHCRLHPRCCARHCRRCSCHWRLHSLLVKSALLLKSAAVLLA